jgi:IQ calmodulin-binding motif.
MMMNSFIPLSNSSGTCSSGNISNEDNRRKNHYQKDKDDEYKQHEEEGDDDHGKEQERIDFLKLELLDALNDRLEQEYNDYYYHQQENDEEGTTSSTMNNNIMTKTKNKSNNCHSASLPSSSTPTDEPNLVETTTSSSTEIKWHHDDYADYYDGNGNLLLPKGEQLVGVKEEDQQQQGDADGSSTLWYQQFYSAGDDDYNNTVIKEEDEEDMSLVEQKSLCFTSWFEDGNEMEKEEVLLEGGRVRAIYDQNQQDHCSKNQKKYEPFPAFDLFQTAYEVTRAKCSEVLDAVKNATEFLDEIRLQKEGETVETDLLDHEGRAGAREEAATAVVVPSGLSKAISSSLSGADDNIGAHNGTISTATGSNVMNISISNMSQSTLLLREEEEDGATRRQENGLTSSNQSTASSSSAAAAVMMGRAFKQDNEEEGRQLKIVIPAPSPPVATTSTSNGAVEITRRTSQRYTDSTHSPKAICLQETCQNDSTALTEQEDRELGRFDIPFRNVLEREKEEDNSYNVGNFNKSIISTNDIYELLRQIELEARKEEVSKKKRRIETLRRRELRLSQERVDFVSKRIAVERIQRHFRKVLMRNLMVRYKNYRQGLTIVERIERDVLLRFSLVLWKHFTLYRRSAWIILRCLRYYVVVARKKAARKWEEDLILLRKETIITKIIHKSCMKAAIYTINTWCAHIDKEKQLEKLESVRRISAIRIQALIRTFSAKRKLAFLRLEASSTTRQSISATCIQSLWRMLQAREHARMLKMKPNTTVKSKAATKIQKVVRGSKIRRKFIAITRKSQFSVEDPELDAMLEEDDIENMLFDIASVEEDENTDVLSDSWVPSLPLLCKRGGEEEDTNNIYDYETQLKNNSEDENQVVSSTSQLSKNGIHLSQQQKLMDEWNIKDHRVLEVRLKQENM